MKFLYLLLLLPAITLANEQDSYCDYTIEKAKAEQLLLQSPRLVLNGGRDSIGALNAVGLGVQESLSNYLKGSLSGKIGDRDCQIYRRVSELTKHINYDLGLMRIDQSNRRIDLIDDQINHLTNLLLTEQDRVNAGTSTVIVTGMLNSAIAKMRVDRASLTQQNALTITPDISPIPLKKLIEETKLLQSDQQQDLNKQSKYDNWDVGLSIGTGSELSGFRPSGRVQPFVLLNMSYSFGASRRSQALDRSGSAYIDWQNATVQGPLYLAQQLYTQIAAASKANFQALTSYQSYTSNLEQNMTDMGKLETPEAHRFLLQLEIDSAANTIEVESMKYSLNQMNKYLAINFDVEVQ